MDAVLSSVGAPFTRRTQRPAHVDDRPLTAHPRKAVRTLAALLLLTTAPLAWAQAPVLVVVESQAPQVRAEDIRTALRDAGIQVRSLLDPAAERATEVLSIAIRRDGRVAKVLLRRDGDVEVRVLRRDRHATVEGWIARPVAALIRAQRALHPRIVDPWGRNTERPIAPSDGLLLAREVIDPWPIDDVRTTCAAAIQLLREVVDPWAQSAQDAPSSERVELTALVEIVDPWRDRTCAECAAGLGAPSPARP